MKTIGNKEIADQLCTLADEKKLPHAILLTGPEHIGKTHIAQILARRILEITDERELTSHPEFFCIETNEEQTSITVDDIRTMIDKQKTKSFNASARVIIIKDIQTATLQAANAILKSIEEPKQNTFFILTAVHTNHTPQTVLSRCAMYRLAHADESEMRSLITDQSEEVRVKKILTWAAGRPGMLQQITHDDVVHAQWYNESRELLHILTSAHDKRLAWVEDVIGRGAKAAKKQELTARIDRSIVMLRALLFSHGLKKKNLAAQLIASLDHARAVKEKLYKNVQPKGLFDTFVLSLPRL